MRVFDPHFEGIFQEYEKSDLLLDRYEQFLVLLDFFYSQPAYMLSMQRQEHSEMRQYQIYFHEAKRLVSRSQEMKMGKYLEKSVEKRDQYRLILM